MEEEMEEETEERHWKSQAAPAHSIIWFARLGSVQTLRILRCVWSRAYASVWPDWTLIRWTIIRSQSTEHRMIATDATFGLSLGGMARSR